MKNVFRDYIKLMTAYFGRIILHSFYFLPIKNNRVMFISMEAKQYSCNPRYITEYMQEKYPGKYEIIWTFQEPERFSYLKERGVKICKYRSLQYYVYKLTSKASVSNYYWGPELPSRKGQLEIQTWHGGGGGTKKASGDDKALYDNKAHYIRCMLDSKRYTVMMASSEMSLKNTVRGAMKFTGPVIGGTPRNDILLTQRKGELKKKVYEAFSVSNKKKILLYAPTWRRNMDEAAVYTLDFKRISRALAKRFGGEWVVLVRLHPQADHGIMKNFHGIIDATDYPDMQELLYSADAAVTDYSSFVWDYSFTYRPCFLYCTDLNEYKEDRDFYTPIETWGFPVCRNNSEIEQAILLFDNQKYRDGLIKRQIFCGSFEDGYATERIMKVIESTCFGNGEIPNEIILL